MILTTIFIISILFNIGFLYILVIQSLNYESTIKIVENYDSSFKSIVAYTDMMDNLLREHPYQLNNVLDDITLEYFHNLHLIRDTLKECLQT